MFNVTAEKETALQVRMERLGIRETDLRETFIRSSGPGGQKVNKTSTCVLLVHVPTGVSIKSQQARTQAMNRFLARRILVERLEALQEGKMSTERMRIEKIRRQKRRRSARAKEKVLEVKHHQSQKKVRRVAVRIHGEKE